MAVKFPLFAVFSAVDEFTGPVGKMARSVYGLGEKFKKAGTVLTVGLTAPLVALGAKATATALEYDHALNFVEARTGATADEMGRLRRMAEDALGSAGVPATARQSAAAMAELARSGNDVADVQTILPGVLRLSIAAQTDQARAAKLTADELDVYGLAAKDAAHVTDVLAFASVKGQQGFDGLETGLQALGARTRALGQTLETNVALLDALADQGVEAGEGAGALAVGIAAIAKPGSDAVRVLERLHVRGSDLKDGTGKVRDFADVLALLERRGAKSTDVLRIFGRSGRALATLFGTGAIARAQAFRGELQANAGAALHFAEVMEHGGAGAMALFQQRWESFLITVAKSGLLENLSALVGTLSRFLGWLNQLSPATLRWVVSLGAVAAAVGPLLLGVGVMLQQFALAWPLISAVATVLGGGLTLAVAGVTAVLLVLSAAIGTVYVYWDILQTKTKDAMFAVKRWVGSAVDWIGEKFRGLTDYVPDWLLSFLGVEQGGAGAAGGVVGRATPPGQLGAARVDRALQRSAGAAGSVSGRVQVDFTNLPRGAKVNAESAGDVGLDVDAGYSLAGGVAG